MCSLLKAGCSACCGLNGAKETQSWKPAGFPEGLGPPLEPPGLRETQGWSSGGRVGTRLVNSQSDFILQALFALTNLLRDRLAR